MSSVSVPLLDNRNTKEIKKLDEEKKELRYNKGVQRVRKNHQYTVINSSSTLNQSSKALNTPKDSDNKMPKRRFDTFKNERYNNKNHVVYESINNKSNDNTNTITVLKNQKLTISMKKKRNSKK